MFPSFYAGGAYLDSLARGKTSPLKIWVFSLFISGIIFAPQKISLPRHYCSLFADWTFFHNKAVGSYWFLC